MDLPWEGLTHTEEPVRTRGDPGARQPGAITVDEMEHWDPALTEDDANDAIQSFMLTNGLPVPVIPRHLRGRLIAAPGGVAVTTDPESGTPYLCKSFWDDEDADGNIALVEALQTRRDHYFLYGIRPSNFHCHLAMVIRSADTALLAKCTSWERRATFVAACHGLLAAQWVTDPVSELRRWVLVSDEPRLQIGSRGDGDANDPAFAFLHPQGWRGQQVDTHDEAISLVNQALEADIIPAHLGSFITQVLSEGRKSNPEG